MKRERIFLMLLGLLFLSACSEVGAKQVELPQNIAAITAPFLNALKQGNAKESEKFLSTSYRDLPKIRFAEAQKILATSPELKPVLVQSKPKSLMGPKDNEYTVLYAVKHKGRWKSIQMRLFALDGEPFEIEYWHAKDEVELPLLMRTADLMNKTLLYGSAFMAALISIFILGLIFFLQSRRKSIVADQRPVAMVVQSSNSDRDTRL